MTRQEYNLKILDILNFYIKKYPELRFNQLLINLNLIKDEPYVYNLESKEIFNKLNKTFNKDKKNSLDNDFCKPDDSFTSILYEKYFKSIKDNNQKNMKNNVEDKDVKNFIEKTQDYMNIDNKNCIGDNDIHDNVENKNDNQEKIKDTKLSLNEFNTIIRDNCANVICNYFYDKNARDDRSIIINKIYRYLWRNLITYDDIDIIKLINNSFNELPTYELNDNFLYNIHLFVISKLFNIYIKVKYNKEFALSDNVFGNVVNFYFKENKNAGYHGSHKDYILYELKSKINIIKTLDEKAQMFLNLYNELNNFFGIKTINEFHNGSSQLYNKIIFPLNDVYIKEIDALMSDINEI